MGGTVWRKWTALLGSFGVYFIPLVGPHAAWFLGQSLVARATQDRSLAWMATDIAVALTAQICVGLALYWSLSGTWIRKIVWLGSIPLAVALNLAYLAIIPAFFLIEADTASEMNTWAEHCFVQSVALRPVRSSVQLGQGARAWWAARAPDGRDTLLRVPGARRPTPCCPSLVRVPKGISTSPSVFSLPLPMVPPSSSKWTDAPPGERGGRWPILQPPSSD